MVGGGEEARSGSAPERDERSPTRPSAALPREGQASEEMPTRQSASQPSIPTRASESVAFVHEGDVLADRYRVERRLGKGGMGEVYLAEHIAIGRKVAIKTLGAELRDKPDVAHRFLREAKTASKVRHPNIVDITDFGHTEQGAPFFVMEYLEGEDLKAVIKREGTLPWARACDIVLQICAALDTAHRQGVVHRDLKPDNVFLLPEGGGVRVKILDFGIAKSITSEEGSDHTQTGVLLGTPEYMSPEQAQDLPLDPRSDIYATGVILYRMLVGRVPFQSKSFMTVLARHIQEPPKPPREAAPERGITAAQEAVVLRCLAKKPEDRYQSASELAAALRGVAVAGRSPSSQRPVAWLFGTLALVAAAALVWMQVAPFGGGAAEETKAPVAAPPVERPAEPVKTAPPEPAPTPVEPAKVEPTPPEPVPQDIQPATGAAPEPEPEKPQKKKDPKKKEPAKSTARAPLESLSGSDLRTGFGAVAGAVKQCQGIPGTTVKVDVTIGTDGKVERASARKPFAGSALGNCVEQAARGARFPALVAAQSVTYPFQL